LTSEKNKNSEIIIEFSCIVHNFTLLENPSNMSNFVTQTIWVTKTFIAERIFSNFANNTKLYY